MSSIRNPVALLFAIIELVSLTNEPRAAGQCMPRNYQGPRTYAEVIDIVFVIDGSGSIQPDDFELQKEGIKNCILGPNAFIPYNSTVAVGVIQFSDDAFVEIHLSVIDSAVTASAIAAQIDDICQNGRGTNLGQGLNAAITTFEMEAFGESFYLVVSTDINNLVNPQNPNEDDRLKLGEEIRTKTLRAAGMAHPATICTVFVSSAETCSVPPEDTPNAFLRLLANTADSGSLLDPQIPGPAYPGQPVGQFNCADTYQQYLALCLDCTCAIRHAGGEDCNGNAVPDICESGDCQPNGVFDVCDIFYGTSTDCNGNRIPDECDPDCNDNAVPDDCDIAADPGLDGDGNGILDQCQILRVDMNAPTVKPRTGFTWERAYLTLQEALTAAANSGGRIKAIYVAEGTHTPTQQTDPNDERTATFQLLNNVVISGGFAGSAGADPYERHTKKHVTVLSGDIGTPGNLADNCYHVVTGSGTDSTAVLDGFTIIGGNADGCNLGDVGKQFEAGIM